MEWVITGLCNYNCPYCCSHGKAYHCRDAIVESVFKLLSGLEGSWLVKLVGGEPMVHPRFLEICERIVESGHRLSMTTNFSSSLSRLKRLISTCGDRFEYITASLHLSQVRSIHDFIEKAGSFNALKDDATDFLVTAVVTEADFDQLKTIENRLDEQGVTFKYQILKTRGRYSHYKREIEDHISSKLISNINALRGEKFFGTYCEAGRLFFRIDVEGDAVRCYSPQPHYHLGNVRNAFARYKEIKPCLARCCTCTVPINRNMIRFGNKAGAAIMAKEYASGILKEVYQGLHRLK